MRGRARSPAAKACCPAYSEAGSLPSLMINGPDANGQLALVQPLLISGVLFALPLSAVLEGRRPSGREWLWALIVVAGLAGAVYEAVLMVVLRRGT